jgi:hypothetical protein
MDAASSRYDQPGEHEILCCGSDAHLPQTVHCGLIEVEGFQKPPDFHLVFASQFTIQFVRPFVVSLSI